MENPAKTHSLVFALVVGNFSNKHHYKLLKNYNISILVFLPKTSIPEVVFAES